METDFIDYKKRAEKRWGATDAYKEYKEKSSGRSDADNKNIQDGLMNIFVEFAKLDCKPADAPAQALVYKLQDYITEHFYTCTDEILAGLGKMYAADGEFKTNIDNAAGEGTTEFVSKAIEHYVL
ncbi:MAG: TipAS antibiotic-recognition domain-containing protein [Eubacterium sp.]|nr:TipAS antibiotic-recognition domain-containing protein [Eubacterium sp.]